MEQSNVCLILANIWLVGAWLVDSVWGWFCMVFISLLWLFMSVYTFKIEKQFSRMKNNLLNKMINELQGKIKKPEKKKK